MLIDTATTCVCLRSDIIQIGIYIGNEAKKQTIMRQLPNQRLLNTTIKCLCTRQLLAPSKCQLSGSRGEYPVARSQVRVIVYA